MALLHPIPHTGNLRPGHRFQLVSASYSIIGSRRGCDSSHWFLYSQYKVFLWSSWPQSMHYIVLHMAGGLERLPARSPPLYGSMQVFCERAWSKRQSHVQTFTTALKRQLPPYFSGFSTRVWPSSLQMYPVLLTSHQDGSPAPTSIHINEAAVIVSSSKGHMSLCNLLFSYLPRSPPTQGRYLFDGDLCNWYCACGVLLNWNCSTSVCTRGGLPYVSVNKWAVWQLPE